MEDLEISFAKFAERAQEKVEAFARQTLQTISENVIEDTPVLTGFLRGQWHASIGGPDAPEKAVDPSGGAAQSQIALTIAELQGGQTLWVMNGAAYARRIEYGWTGEGANGTYTVNGRHMVTDNLARGQAVAEAVASKLAGLL